MENEVEVQNPRFTVLAKYEWDESWHRTSGDMCEQAARSYLERRKQINPRAKHVLVKVRYAMVNA